MVSAGCVDYQCHLFYIAEYSSVRWNGMWCTAVSITRPAAMGNKISFNKHITSPSDTFSSRENNLVAGLVKTTLWALNQGQV